jgi:hypothetical protein
MNDGYVWGRKAVIPPMTRQERIDRQRMLDGFREYNELAAKLGLKNRFYLVGDPETDPDLIRQREREEEIKRKNERAKKLRLAELRERRQRERADSCAMPRRRRRRKLRRKAS